MIHCFCYFLSEGYRKLAAFYIQIFLIFVPVASKHLHDGKARASTQKAEIPSTRICINAADKTAVAWV